MSPLTSGSEKGRKELRAVLGDKGEELFAELRSAFPDLARLYVEYPYGEIYSRPHLDLKSRELIAIGIMAAQGTARTQLITHMHGALNVGCSREQILEVVLMSSVFAGFPAALNAWGAAKEAFEEHDNPEKGETR
jgi:4-carboxymuconolactone decarboxylase